MAVTNQPIFTQVANLGLIKIATINTGRDGSGTLGTVVTAGAAGTKITSIIIKAEVTTTAGMVRLFITLAGTTYIFMEIPITAITVAANTPSFYYRLEFADMVLPNGAVLKAGTEKGESFVITAFGADF